LSNSFYTLLYSHVSVTKVGSETDFTQFRHDLLIYTKLYKFLPLLEQIAEIETFKSALVAYLS